MPEALTGPTNLSLGSAQMPTRNEILSVFRNLSRDEIMQSLLGSKSSRYYDVALLFSNNGSTPEFYDIEEAAGVNDTFAQVLQWIIIADDSEAVDCEASRGTLVSDSVKASLAQWDIDREFEAKDEEARSSPIEISEIDSSIAFIEGALSVARMKMEGSLEPYERLDGSLSTE